MANFRFWRDQRGVVSLVFTLSTIGIMVALLSGIDMMRWAAVEARAQNALDAAVLAAGRNLGNLTTNPTAAQTAAWKADALGYFKANWPDSYLDSNIDTNNVSITMVNTPASGSTPAGQTLSMSLTGSLPLLVSGFLGNAPLTVAASNQALRVAKNNLEVVLVLDNTGSMNDSASGSGGTSKLSALKSAASTLIDLLTPTTNSGASVYFGLVPFTTVVNVRDANGNLPTSWLDNSRVDASSQAMQPTAPFSSNSWNGCLSEAQPLTNPLTLQTPANRPFRAYFDGWDTNQGWSWGWNGWGWGWVKGAWQYSNFLQKYCPAQPTTFLTTNTTTLKQSINSMVANGSTFIASGVLWAWRMLAPTWRNKDSGKGWGSDTLPQDNSAYLTKAMIIITDGANVWQLPTSSFSLPDLSKTSLSGNYYTAPNSAPILGDPNGSGSGEARVYGDYHGNLSPFGSTSSNDGDPATIAVVDAIQIQVCKQAAADGIKIWGIVYGSDSGTAHSMTVMRQCVTQAAYYAPTDQELQKDFQSIAGQLSTLRLTK